MADAAVTIKLKPREFDVVRDALIAFYEDSRQVTSEARDFPAIEVAEARQAMTEISLILENFGCYQRDGSYKTS